MWLNFSSLLPPQTKLREGDVCLFTGRGSGIPPDNRHLPGNRRPRNMGTDTPLGADTHPENSHSQPWEQTPPRNHKSGRHASYWNAFLFRDASDFLNFLLTHVAKAYCLLKKL